MNPADFTWHALYCAPKQELATAHKAGLMNIPCIVPGEKTWRDRKRVVKLPGQKPRRVTHEVYTPVFPRYVFAGFPAKPNWELLRERVPAVQGYMAFGHGGPAILNFRDVQWLMELRDRLAGKAPPLPFAQTIKPGDKVKVAPSSPFAGKVVTVDKVVAKEIHTMQEFLGGLVLVKIGIDQLEPA